MNSMACKQAMGGEYNHFLGKDLTEKTRSERMVTTMGQKEVSKIICSK